MNTNQSNQSNQSNQPNQNMTNNMGNSLAMQSFQNIPTPNPAACEIVAQVKTSGTVTGYQLSNGITVDMQTAVTMAKNGSIKGVGVATNQGTEYLRSLPDGNEANNLNNLPTASN